MMTSVSVRFFGKAFKISFVSSKQMMTICVLCSDFFRSCKERITLTVCQPYTDNVSDYSSLSLFHRRLCAFRSHRLCCSLTYWLLVCLGLFVHEPGFNCVLSRVYVSC